MPGFAGIVSLNTAPVAEDQLYQFIRKHPGNQPVILERIPEASPEIFFSSFNEDLPFPVSPCTKTVKNDLALYFFGEIFNAELRGKDIGIALLEAYESEGVDCFTRLNGSFAVIIYNKTLDRLQIINDRSASIPFYYLQTDALFAFSFRIKPLINLLPGDPTISSEAMAHYLSNGFCLNGYTLIDGIKALAPGKVITISKTDVSHRTYWQYIFKPIRREIPKNEAIAELGQLVFEAIHRRIEDEEEFGVLLSGGYDSRAILGSVLRKYPNKKIKTITWGEKSGKKGSDAEVAQKIASYYKTHHTFYNINPESISIHFRNFVQRDEGRTDSVGNYPEGLHIFEQIRDALGVKYLLRGDEVFGWKADISDPADLFHSMDIHELEGLPRNFQYIKMPVLDKLKSAGQEVLLDIMADIPYSDLHDTKDHIYFNQRLFNYLNPLSYLKSQVIWMRNPFLDNDLLEFISNMQTEYRLGKNLFIETVKSMFPELNRFPIATTNNLVNWAKRFQSDIILQKFTYKVLFEEANQFDEIIDQAKLKTFFEKAVQSPENGLPGGKRVYTIKDRMQSRLNRSLGYYYLSPCCELFRLMILKIFTDEFLGGSFKLN